jgi:hypothetical protein
LYMRLLGNYRSNIGRVPSAVPGRAHLRRSRPETAASPGGGGPVGGRGLTSGSPRGDNTRADTAGDSPSLPPQRTAERGRPPGGPGLGLPLLRSDSAVSCSTPAGQQGWAPSLCTIRLRSEAGVICAGACQLA